MEYSLSIYLESKYFTIMKFRKARGFEKEVNDSCRCSNCVDEIFFSEPMYRFQSKFDMNGEYIEISYTSSKNIKYSYLFLVDEAVFSEDANSSCLTLRGKSHGPSKGTIDLINLLDSYEKLNKGLWLRLDSSVLPVWLDIARKRMNSNELRSGYEATIDCKLISSEDAFFCALGEAVNGPVGYFGSCLNSLDDCMAGDFGIHPPLILRFLHSSELIKTFDDQGRFLSELGSISGVILKF